MKTRYKYEPNYAVHPGETLKEKLDEMGMSHREFAARTGKPNKTISEIMNGKSSITPEMSVRFEKVLQIPASFWMKKQLNYNEFIVRESDNKTLELAFEWAKQFPYPQMAKLGLVKATKDIKVKVTELLYFFNISNHTIWEDIYMNMKLPVFFRISLKHARDPYALSALLRMGEIEADKIKTIDFNLTILKSILPELKKIMVEKPDNYLQIIQTKCLLAGVKVIYTSNLPKTVINGTVRWLNNHPVLQMTDRLKRYDVFWFSFFHEIGHIILHRNKKNIFLEQISSSETIDKQEKEADIFASQWLLKDMEYEKIVSEIQSRSDIMKTIKFYASEYNTHKDIIIGRILYQNKNLYKYGFLQTEINKVNFNEQIEL